LRSGSGGGRRGVVPGAQILQVRYPRVCHGFRHSGDRRHTCFNARLQSEQSARLLLRVGGEIGPQRLQTRCFFRRELGERLDRVGFGRAEIRDEFAHSRMRAALRLRDRRGRLLAERVDFSLYPLLDLLADLRQVL
jgi:hypothetical protein